MSASLFFSSKSRFHASGHSGPAPRRRPRSHPRNAPPEISPDIFPATPSISCSRKRVSKAPTRTVGARRQTRRAGGERGADGRRAQHHVRHHGALRLHRRPRRPLLPGPPPSSCEFIEIPMLIYRNHHASLSKSSC